MLPPSGPGLPGPALLLGAPVALGLALALLLVALAAWWRRLGPAAPPPARDAEPEGESGFWVPPRTSKGPRPNQREEWEVEGWIEGEATLEGVWLRGLVLLVREPTGPWDTPPCSPALPTQGSFQNGARKGCE